MNLVARIFYDLEENACAILNTYSWINLSNTDYYLTYNMHIFM